MDGLFDSNNESNEYSTQYWPHDNFATTRISRIVSPRLTSPILQTGGSDRIASTTATVNGSDSRDTFSTHARRLGLRNAGFRAALIPTRRLSPPQAKASQRLENDENAGSIGKTRNFSNSDVTTSPLGILQEINNSSIRPRRASRTPLADIFGYADDEKDENHPDSIDSMLFKTGSLKSAKNRKRVKRVSSFQSTKYIEYLETELGAATEKLESLQSPDTVKGQASKIRKLEKRIQDLQQHLTDWEHNYEERVNDQVFERLHGESSLRLKINTLEEAAAHKEAHIAELGKELEDAKVRLMESESVETTLSKRIDALTELLVKSGARTSFSIGLADTPSLQRTIKPILSATATSPIRAASTFDALNTALHGGCPTQDVGEDLGYLSGENILETDSESYDLEGASRPVSGVFSSRSSQTSSSRPTSMFSTASFGAWAAAAEEKPAGRPKRPRRFAPGATCLKPLLLPTTAGLSQPLQVIKTPTKEYIESTDESPYLSATEQSSTTPSRPKARRPYSWAHSPAVTRHMSIREDDESGDDTFVVGTSALDDLPEYLRHMAPQPSPDPSPQVKERAGSTPPRSGLSLNQELELDDSFSGFSDASQAVEQSRCQHQNITKTNESTLRPGTTRPALSSTTSIEQDESFMSDISDAARTDAQSKHATKSLTNVSAKDLLPAGLKTSYLTNLVVSLRQNPLNIARQVLLQSWTRGSTRFGGFAWWILGLVFLPRKRKGTSAATTTPAKASDEQIPTTQLGISTTTHNKPIGTSGSTRTSELLARIGMANVLPQLKALASTNSSQPYRCPHCVEPSGKRSIKLWTKLALAIMVAIGYAVLEGPATVLEAIPEERCAEDPGIVAE